MSFSLPTLSFDYNALEPHLDAQTMEIHYAKHHQAYVDKLNVAVQGTGFEGVSIEKLISKVGNLSAAVRNNGGGHWNHSFFWQILSASPTPLSSGSFSSALESKFGSVDEMKNQFNQVAMGRFGSGWAWLVLDESKQLTITSTLNQDNPLMDVVEVKGTPLVGVDVWEHAYYLKYQNRRADYLSAVWNVIDWSKVEQAYAAAL